MKVMLAFLKFMQCMEETEVVKKIWLNMDFVYHHADNRPLKFEEFENLQQKVLYVGATPSDYELRKLMDF